MRALFPTCLAAKSYGEMSSVLNSRSISPPALAKRAAPHCRVDAAIHVSTVLYILSFHPFHTRERLLGWLSCFLIVFTVCIRSPRRCLGGLAVNTMLLTRCRTDGVVDSPKGVACDSEYRRQFMQLAQKCFYVIHYFIFQRDFRRNQNRASALNQCCRSSHAASSGQDDVFRQTALSELHFFGAFLLGRGVCL